MKSIAAVSRVKVSADGHGVVSHAGVGMLREFADLTGLSTQVTAVLADTYRGPWIYDPGAVFADLAAAVADGADCIDGVGQRCGDREHVFGPAASTTTMWRLVDQRIDAAHLPGIRAARAPARAAAWAAGRPRRQGSGCTSTSMPPSPSTIPTTRRTRPRPGRRPGVITRCWCSSTAPRSPVAKHWPGCCDRATRGVIPPPTTSPCWSRLWNRCRRRTGRTRTILPGNRFWCAPIPPARPTRSPTPAAGRGGILLRLRRRRPRARRGRDPQHQRQLVSGDRLRRRHPRRRLGRRGHRLVEMSSWPAGTRLILRKERPHPGAQLRFTDSDGLRITAFITDTPTGVVPGQLGGLELRHRQHARVEDRIRQAKATGLPTCPATASDANAAWLEIILAATDLVAWTKLIGFTEPTGSGHVRDRHLPLPGPARRRPHHPRRPTDPVSDRRHLAMGHRHLPRMASPPGRLHLTPSSPSTRPEDPPALETPARRATPADSSCPDATINPISRPAPAPSEPNRPREKSRLEGR